MDHLVTNKLDALRHLCERHCVARLELFGSAATAEFDHGRSDLDFIVEFRELPFGDRADAFFGLLHDLENLFDRRIDLLESSAVRNPFLLASINRTRVQVYAAA